MLEVLLIRIKRATEIAVFTELILNLEMLWFKYTSRWHLNKLEEKKRRIHIQQERSGKASLAVPTRDLQRILIKGFLSMYIYHFKKLASTQEAR